jgi:tRNA(fMet)-specific endonuclease VapC
MATDFLLDTSPIVAHLRKKFNISATAPDGALLFTSLFTLGELEKGIARARTPSRERAKVESFMQHIAILTPDSATAKTYGRISAELDAKGERIPENDTWIAAIALECDMTLATGDAHFSRISGLKVEHWTW